MNKEISKLIVEKRPESSKSTVRTYTSLLSTFVRKSIGEVGIEEIKEYFDNTERVLENENKDASLSSRKTLLSALYVVTGKMEYRTLMMTVASEHTKEIRQQKKNEKQAKNWMSYEEVMSVVEKYRKDTVGLFRSKEPLVGPEFMKAQKYIILALTTGVYIPPRRSLDWTQMNLRNADASNNFIDKSNFHFVTYKTAKTYGKQVVEMPRALRMLLTKWMKINPSDYLLVNMSGGRMSNSELVHQLNAIFEKNVSTTLLRNIYITNKFGDMPKLKDMEAVAEKMGHNVSMQMKYIKR